MKKLFALVLIFSLSLTFFSCSDDEQVYNWRGNWNDPKDPNYKADGYNPIEGMWRIGERGLYFSKDFKVHDVTYHEGGKFQIGLYKDIYIINDEAFRYQTYPQTIRYKVEGDKLYISEYLFNDDWAIYTRFVPTEPEPETPEE